MYIYSIYTYVAYVHRFLLVITFLSETLGTYTVNNLLGKMHVMLLKFTEG